MRIAVPTLEDKVAPNIDLAEGVLILEMAQGRVGSTEFIGCPIYDKYDLVRVLQAYQIEALICGRLTLEQEQAVHSLELSIIHGPPCTVEEAIKTLEKPLFETNWWSSA